MQNLVRLWILLLESDKKCVMSATNMPELKPTELFVLG
jgi:hypothetical protein